MYIVNFCRNRQSWETQADTKAAGTYTAEYNIAYGVHITSSTKVHVALLDSAIALGMY